MFLAFSQTPRKCTVTFITGGDAYRVDQWNQGKPPLDLEIGLLPTIIMDGDFPNLCHQATWTSATLQLSRREQTAPTTTLSPPIQRVKMFDRPEYKLVQWDPNGMPRLAYKEFTTPGPLIRGNAILVQLASVDDLKHVSPNKRIYPLPFPGVKPPNLPAQPMPPQQLGNQITVNTPQGPMLVTLPDPVPAVPAPALVNFGAGPSQTQTQPGARTSARAYSAPTQSASHQEDQRLPRPRLRTTPTRQRVNQKLLTYSPSLGPGKTYRVDGLGSLNKKSRTSVKVNLSLTRDDTDDDDQAGAHNETIVISDTSHEDTSKDTSRDDDQDNDTTRDSKEGDKDNKEKGEKEKGGPHN